MLANYPEGQLVTQVFNVESKNKPELQEVHFVAKFVAQFRQFASHIAQVKGGTAVLP